MVVFFVFLDPNWSKFLKSNLPDGYSHLPSSKRSSSLMYSPSHHPATSAARAQHCTLLAEKTGEVSILPRKAFLPTAPNGTNNPIFRSTTIHFDKEKFQRIQTNVKTVSTKSRTGLYSTTTTTISFWRCWKIIKACFTFGGIDGLALFSVVSSKLM